MARPARDSNFRFVRDESLRENLDRVFDHIIELISLAESTKYDKVLKSSFRKTIIIYTASIIEALLLYILKQNKSEDKYAQTKTEFKIIKEIYPVSDSQRIVLGEDKTEKERMRFNKINLDQINKLCHEHYLIDENLYENVDKVRALRNRQHLGGLKGVDRDYTKKDLELVFSVARKVKEQARNLTG